jgi:hypothetical protein
LIHKKRICHEWSHFIDISTISIFDFQRHERIESPLEPLIKKTFLRTAAGSTSIIIIKEAHFCIRFRYHLCLWSPSIVPQVSISSRLPTRILPPNPNTKLNIPKMITIFTPKNTIPITGTTEWSRMRMNIDETPPIMKAIIVIGRNTSAKHLL